MPDLSKSVDESYGLRFFIIGSGIGILSLLQ